MSSQENAKLPRFVKTILDIIFAVLVFTCISLILLILISPLIIKVVDIPLTASVPVGIGSPDAQRFDVQVSGSAAKGIRYAFVDQAQGILRLETHNWANIFISYFGKLLIAIGLTIFFYLLRAVMKDILKGDPFSLENTIRVRKIGYSVLLLGFIIPTIEYIAANEIIRGMNFEPVLSLPSPFKIEFLLSSLLILLLAQVWSYGLELKRDQELTI